MGAMKGALYAGSFDPIHRGHVDLIERAARIFGGVTVVIGHNLHKSSLLDLEQRRRLVTESVASIEGVSVDTFEGLLVDYARREGFETLVRGIRGGGDLDYELAMAAANGRLEPGIETVFLPAAPEFLLYSSSLVREIHAGGRDVSSYVPSPVATFLESASSSR